MVTYLLIGKKKIIIKDPYFLPEEGMNIWLEEKGFLTDVKVRLKHIIHKISNDGEIEQELICE